MGRSPFRATAGGAIALFVSWGRERRRSGSGKETLAKPKEVLKRFTPSAPHGAAARTLRRPSSCEMAGEVATVQQPGAPVAYQKRERRVESGSNFTAIVSYIVRFFGVCPLA